MILFPPNLKTPLIGNSAGLELEPRATPIQGLRLHIHEASGSSQGSPYTASTVCDSWVPDSRSTHPGQLQGLGTFSVIVHTLKYTGAGKDQGQEPKRAYSRISVSLGTVWGKLSTARIHCFVFKTEHVD